MASQPLLFDMDADKTDMHEAAHVRDSDADVRFDWVVLLIAGALMTLGVVVVYSASVTVKSPPFDPARWWDSPLRQGVFALVGFLGMALVSQIPSSLWAWRDRGWCPPIVLFTLSAVLLLAVFVPGIGASRLGAQRAIVLMTSPISLSFQPSELAKVTLVIWVAAIIARQGEHVKRLAGGFSFTVLPAFLLIALTGIEDFGTAALMGLVLLGMLVVGGARKRHVGGIVLLGLLGGIALVAMKTYRLKRLFAFWFADEVGDAGERYQVTQSLIAIGSGGWWGRGLGQGVQKYGYLPQDNNDFIFAIVCEELGVIGGIVVIGLFLLLLYRGWRISHAASDPFGRLLAVGITLTICLQAVMNIAVVTDLVPTKGISLPFVSAGGSGVVFLGVAAGLLAAAAREHPRAVEPALDASES